MLKRDKHDRLYGTVGNLPHNERNKLFKQASAMRKQMLSRGQRVSIDEIVQQLMEEPAPPKTSPKAVLAGTVVWSSLKTARIRNADGEFEAQLNGNRVAVGDQVDFAELLDGNGYEISDVRPRNTWLARLDVGNKRIERVVAANIDAVAIVVSVKSPPLHPRLIDRYLIAIQSGGAIPFVVVNKLDLLAGQEDELKSELAKLEPYLAIGVPVFRCSSETGEGIEELREFLRGKSCAFVGHSGVGKSSVLNSLFPELDLKVGGLIQGYGRGAHTTTVSNLFDFEEGTRLIDTPGIRSLGLADLSREELQSCFPEFEGISCRFRDCSHQHEPGCGVRTAAESGEIHRARYDTYLRLFEEMGIAQ